MWNPSPLSPLLQSALVASVEARLAEGAVAFVQLVGEVPIQSTVKVSTFSHPWSSVITTA